MVLFTESESAAASLREALDLLGDWEDDFDPLFALATPPPSPALLGDQKQTASPDAKRRAKRRHGDETMCTPTEYRLRRDARKAAIAELQTQAADLQRLLEDELAQRAKPRAAEHTGSALEQEWEAMAVRQKRQRVAAEVKYAALRGGVVAQGAIARRIVKLTRKAATKIRDCLGDAPRLRMSAYSGPVAPIPQLVRYLDCRLDESRAVLSSGAFKENSGDFRRVGFRDLGFDGLQSEFTVSCVVPFGVDAVAAALWSLMSGSCHRGRVTDHQLTHSAPDLMVTNFVSAPRPNGVPSCNHGQGIAGTSHGQTALRRYDGDGDDWDGSRFLTLRIRGAVFDDDGTRKGDLSTDMWLQVEPVTTTKTTAITRQLSRLKWCSRVTGRPVDYDTTPPAARAKWIHSIVAGPMHTVWEENLMRFVQLVENTLLQQVWPVR